MTILIAESGSRGAASKRKTLESYFTSKAVPDGPGLFQTSTGSAAAPSTATVKPESTASTPIAIDLTNSAPQLTKASASSGSLKNVGAAKPPTLAAIAASQQSIALAAELRKELETTKAGKEQIENKVRINIRLISWWCVTDCVLSVNHSCNGRSLSCEHITIGGGQQMTRTPGKTIALNSTSSLQRTQTVSLPGCSSLWRTSTAKWLSASSAASGRSWPWTA